MFLVQATALTLQILHYQQSRQNQSHHELPLHEHDLSHRPIANSFGICKWYYETSNHSCSKHYATTLGLPETKEPPCSLITSMHCLAPKNPSHCVSENVVQPERIMQLLKFHIPAKTNKVPCLIISLQHTVSSTITPRMPLCSHLIGVSEPTLPDTATMKGRILLSNSSN